jgi:uncharacterized repeat protein (TIGR03843 family)
VTPTEGIKVLGRLEHASNSTLLVEIADVRYVYKPIAGERPLWDFPDRTLANREVAAYRISQLLGWDLVPPTSLVEGPEGLGSLQLWVDAEIEEVDLFAPDEVPDNWFSIIGGIDEEGKEIVLAHSAHPMLAQLAVFDVIVNNADRKAGHILTPIHGGLVGIDHGVTFHEEPKLRTVLWGWINSRIDDQLIADLKSLVSAIPESDLPQLLAPAEVDALIERINDLIEDPTYPEPSGEWPSVPWPVF